MDAQTFDDLLRGLSAAASRRGVVTGLAGTLLAALPLASVGDAKGKNRKGKNKGNRKGCGKGKRKCGKKCVSKGKCCEGEECPGCRSEVCLNGTCQCGPDLNMHNGLCGFFIDCKGFGLICTSDEECCSNHCSIDAGQGQMRCALSTTRCLLDFDCASGPCQGYSCPESNQAYFSECQ